MSIKTHYPWCIQYFKQQISVVTFGKTAKKTHVYFSTYNAELRESGRRWYISFKHYSLAFFLTKQNIKKLNLYSHSHFFNTKYFVSEAENVFKIKQYLQAIGIIIFICSKMIADLQKWRANFFFVKKVKGSANKNYTMYLKKKEPVWPAFGPKIRT